MIYISLFCTGNCQTKVFHTRCETDLLVSSYISLLPFVPPFLGNLRSRHADMGNEAPAPERWSAVLDIGTNVEEGKKRSRRAGGFWSRLAAEDLVDLLEGLLLGDAVLLGHQVGEGFLVALAGGKVGGGELVEFGTEGRLGRVVRHCDADWGLKKKGLDEFNILDARLSGKIGLVKREGGERKGRAGQGQPGELFIYTIFIDRTYQTELTAGIIYSVDAPPPLPDIPGILDILTLSPGVASAGRASWFVLLKMRASHWKSG